MVTLLIMMAALEGRGRSSSREVRGYIWERIAPAPEQQASSVGPSPATCALCGQILSPLCNSIPHCKMSGFRGSVWVSGVLDEVVLIDRHAEGTATQQALLSWVGALRLYFWTPAVLGSALFILQMGNGGTEVLGAAVRGRAFLAIPGHWAPPHTISPRATAIGPPPFPAGPRSPLTRDRTGPLSSELPGDLLCGTGLLLALSGSWLLLCGPEEDLVVPDVM